MPSEPVDLGVPGVEEAVEIGRGGFATVYRARQTALERFVAIKVVHPGILTAPDLTFEREVRAAARLSQHPNVVPVYAVGTTTSGLAYMVMPYYERGSLAARLERSGALPEELAVRLGRKLASTLDYVHQHGVVHRDIKPANILLAEGDEPVLGDFGVAKVTNASVALQTVGANVVTWAYGPPEAFTGGQPTPAWDIYSLGATVYSMLTGSAPFIDDEDANIFAVLNRIGNVDVPDLTVRGVSVPVAAAVRQAMAKAPEDRPSSAAAFGAMLGRVAPEPAPGRPPEPSSPVPAPARAPIAPRPVAVSPTEVAGGPGIHDAAAVASATASESDVAASVPPGPDAPPPGRRWGDRTRLVVAALIVATIVCYGVGLVLPLLKYLDGNSFDDRWWGDTSLALRLVITFAGTMAMVVGLVLVLRGSVADGIAFEWLVGAAAASVFVDLGHDLTSYLPHLSSFAVPALALRIVAGVCAGAVLVVAWSRGRQPGPRLPGAGRLVLLAGAALVVVSVWITRETDGIDRIGWLLVNAALLVVLLVRALALAPRTTGAAALVAAGAVGMVIWAGTTITVPSTYRWHVVPGAVGFALITGLGVQRWLRGRTPGEPAASSG